MTRCEDACSVSPASSSRGVMVEMELPPPNAKAGQMAHRTITKDEAIAALNAAAWTESGEGYDPCSNCGHREKEPRTIVHCNAGAFGADWGLSDAIVFIQESDAVVWQWSLTNHDLAARRDDSVRSFDVRAPDDVRHELLEETRLAIRAS